MVGSVRRDRVPTSTRMWRAERAKKMNKSPCSSRCSLAAMQRGIGHELHWILFAVFQNSPGYLSGSARPRVRPRGRATQRARGEIFKLSLPTGQSKS